MALTSPVLPARVPVRVIRASLLGGLPPRRRLLQAIQEWPPPPLHRAARLMLPRRRRRRICPARQRQTRQAHPTPRARWADQAKSGSTRLPRSTTVPVTAIMAKQRRASSCPSRPRRPRAIIPAVVKPAQADNSGLRWRWRDAVVSRHREPRPCLLARSAPGWGEPRRFG